MIFRNTRADIEKEQLELEIAKLKQEKKILETEVVGLLIKARDELNNIYYDLKGIIG